MYFRLLYFNKRNECFFRNQQQEKKSNYEVQNKSIFEDITLSEEGLEEIDKSSNEYQVVYTIEDKIINTIYIAKKIMIKIKNKV